MPILTQKDSLLANNNITNYKKNGSSNYHKSGSRSKNNPVNNISESSGGTGSTGASSKHKYLSHKSAGPPVKAILDGGAGLGGPGLGGPGLGGPGLRGPGLGGPGGLHGGQISSSREGSFRFLEHEEIEHTPNAKKPQHKTVGDDTSSIQWSSNSDRLI